MSSNAQIRTLPLLRVRRGSGKSTPSWRANSDAAQADGQPTGHGLQNSSRKAEHYRKALLVRHRRPRIKRGAALRMRPFGPDHLVTGSDYPVLLPYENYAKTFSYIREAGLPIDVADQILYRSGPTLFGL
jgi:hypothetical protein